MAYYKTKWFQELPTPWDADVRGKFCIHTTEYDVYQYRDTGSPDQDKFYTYLKKEINDTGKLEWLKQNEVDLSSLKVTGIYETSTASLRVAVYIDLPQKIRTLYTLRFTE